MLVDSINMKDANLSNVGIKVELLSGKIAIL